MSNIIYLSIKGKIQGLISEGCGSYASIGNKYQINNVDEIFVLQFDHSLSREYNVVHHPIKFYKPIDKSSPLLNERFYTIELQGAHLSNILTCYPHSITHAGNQPEEVIVLNYKNITWKHHIASTESYSCWEERIF